MSKSEHPWMKFYSADWRSDAALRSVTFGARGLWIDLLSLMHEATPYGHLLISGRPPSIETISAVLGGRPKEVGNLFKELEDACVFSRTEDGTVYSRRMVRDKARAERDRENGKGGGNPQLLNEVKGGVNPPDKGEDKAQIPEARSQRLESEKNKTLGADAPEFEAFFKAYPRRGPHPNPRKPALLKFNAAVKRGADPQKIIAAAKAFEVSSRGTDPKFIPQAVTWLSQARWADTVEKAPQTFTATYVDNGPTVTL
jgi:hypothetical protein